MCFTIKWPLLLAIVLFQVFGTFGGIISFVEEPFEEALNDENLEELSRAKRSMTTICVEIKPSTPQEEPYYMCKGAEFPMGQKSGNLEFGTQISSPSANSDGESYKSFPASGKPGQNPSESISFSTKISKSFTSPGSQNVLAQTFHEPSGNYFQNSQENPARSFERISQQNPSFSQPNLFRANENFYGTEIKNAPASLSQKEQQQSFISTASKPTQQTFYQAPNSFPGNQHDQGKIVGSSELYGNSNTYGNPNTYGSANSFRSNIQNGNPQTFRGSNTNGNSNPFENIRSNENPQFIGNVQPTGRNRYIQASQRPHFSSEGNNNGAFTQPRFGSLQANAKEPTPQSSYYSPNRADASSPSQIQETLGKTSSSSPYASPEIKVQTTASGGNPYINSPYHHELSGVVTTPRQQRKLQAELGDDVLGVPNWNFSPDEFKIVGGSEEPIVLSQRNPEWQYQQRSMPEEYMDDPVMRTFYESLHDMPTTPLFPTSQQARASLLGEIYPKPFPNAFYPIKQVETESCPNNPNMPDTTNNPNVGGVQSFSTASSYSFNNPMENSNPNIYHPVVIALPCCSGQQPSTGPGHPYSNLGMANPFQPSDPMVGSSLGQFLGFRRPFSFSNIFSMFNPMQSPLQSLLGESNPMQRSQIMMPQQISPFGEHQIIGLANPILSYPNPFYGLPNPRFSSPNPMTTAPLLGASQTSAHPMDPSKQMVAFTNPFNFLTTTLPSIVAKTLKKAEDNYNKNKDSSSIKDLLSSLENDDTDRDLENYARTTPVLGSTNESDELFNSNEKPASEKSSQPKEKDKDDLVADSVPEISAEEETTKAIVNTTPSTTTTPPTTPPNDSASDEHDELYERFRTNTARALEMIKNAKKQDELDKRSASSPSSVKMYSTDHIQRRGVTQATSYKRKYVQKL